MTPTQQPNAALEWRLEAIDRLEPLQLARFLNQLKKNGIGIGPRVTPGYNQLQLKQLTGTMTAFLKLLDEVGDET
jgi:hypothetical protein